MRFEFYSAGKIIFGNGVFSEIGSTAGSLAKKALVVLGKSSFQNTGHYAQLISSLEENNVSHVMYENVPPEPDTDAVDNGVKAGMESNVDIVIGIGGGSVIDTAKAISGILTNGGVVSDYLEKIGRELPVTKPSLPYIAVPTTAGTGSEVTKNAVIYSKEKQVKRSMRSPFLIPDIVIADPELTLSLPKEQTAYSGMDALTQLIEAYVSKKLQPMVSALAIHGIECAGRSLETAYKDGSNAAAREDMLLASMLSGLALANASLGAVHAFSSSLGAFSIPHGKICAILLPYITKENLPFDVEKYGNIGRALTKKEYMSDKEAGEAGLEYIYNLCSRLSIPKDFREYGIGKDRIPDIVNNAGQTNLNANPKQFTEQELYNLIERVI